MPGNDPAAIPPDNRRRFGGGKILRERRGKACLVLNGLRHIVFLLLNEFVPPVFELFCHCLNARGLFNRLVFRFRCIVVTQARVWQLGFEVGGVFVEALSEFIEHLNGVVQFGGSGYQHRKKRGVARMPEI